MVIARVPSPDLREEVEKEGSEPGMRAKMAISPEGVVMLK